MSDLCDLEIRLDERQLGRAETHDIDLSPPSARFWLRARVRHPWLVAERSLVRVQTFRAWFVGAMNQSVGVAKRAGHAMTRKLRNMRGSVEAGAAIGDDESEFGGGRSRAWFQQVEEYLERFLRLFEKSSFERFRPVEGFFRRLLGLPPRAMPEVAAPKKPPPKQLTAPNPIDAKEAARLKAEIRQQMIMANARGTQNLRPVRERSQSVTSAPLEPTVPPEPSASSGASTHLAAPSVSDSFSAPTDPKVPVAEGPRLPLPREIATEAARAPDLGEVTSAAAPVTRPGPVLEATQAAVPVVKLPRSGPEDTWAHEETSGRQKAVDVPKLDPRALTTDFDFELRSMATAIADRPTEPPTAAPAAAKLPEVYAEPGIADIRHVQTQPLTEAFSTSRRPLARSVSFTDPEMANDFFEETDPEAKALEATEDPSA